MHHYVYRIDRPSTGEWYVGIRSSAKAPLEDTGYMGSGKRVKLIDNAELVKTVLVQVQDRDEAARLEHALIGADQVADPICMNEIHGGSKGKLGYVTSDKTKAKIREANLGKPGSHVKHDEATLAKMSASAKADPKRAARLRKLNEDRGPVTDTTRARMSKAAKGKPKTAEHVQKVADAHRGMKRSEEAKANMRAAWARRKKK
tara:strand:- start:18323 stop:18931 length:609 start_codon:yes stop_codon:yes gene_type:complete